MCSSVESHIWALICHSLHDQPRGSTTNRHTQTESQISGQLFINCLFRRRCVFSASLQPDFSLSFSLYSFGRIFLSLECIVTVVFACDSWTCRTWTSENAVLSVYVLHRGGVCYIMVPYTASLSPKGELSEIWQPCCGFAVLQCLNFSLFFPLLYIDSESSDLLF